MSDLTDGSVFSSHPSIFYHFSLNGGWSPSQLLSGQRRGHPGCVAAPTFNLIHKYLIDVDKKIRKLNKRIEYEMCFSC